ncbi:MAG TPA: hypothetical protein VGR47_10535 [Terracidiphilus sp.]|nr:hypothetical protein [Terracidiphilus sp.]
MAQQKFKTLTFGTYVKTVLVVEPGHAHHGHCLKCGACLMSPIPHKCPRRRKDADNGHKDAFWMKPSAPAPRGHKTTKLKSHYNGISLAKVLKLADRYYRPLRANEVEAVRQLNEHKLRNSGLSDRRGEPSRPVLSVEEKFESRIWSVNPVTGERVLIATKTMEEKKRIVTVTSHAQAIAALTDDDGDDIPDLEYSRRETAWSQNHDEAAQ